MGDYVAYERGLKEGDVHPVVAAMNEVGIDAGTIGNHEFNYGLPFLGKGAGRRALPGRAGEPRQGALGPGPRDDQTLVKPYVILDRELVDGSGAKLPIRVGVIGFTPPQVMVWDRAHLEGRVQARDIVATARAYIPQMREEGAELVVALSHSGIAAGPAAEGAENASLHLATVDGFDAILTGHQHRVFPGETFAGIEGVDLAAGRLMGVPAAMPGFWGSHLGIVDLTLAREGGRWRVLESRVENRPISKRGEGNKVEPLVASDERVLASVQEQHQATLTYVRRPVGRTSPRSPPTSRSWPTTPRSRS
jgi:2',3'-cyclic-nucleotide 2'-phosphodiesterase/3'-nucleotidase